MKKRLYISILTLLMSCLLFVGVAFSITAAKNRKTQLHYNFHDFSTTTTIELTDSVSGKLNSKNDEVVYDINVSNMDVDNAFTYIFEISATSDDTMSLSSFLCYVDSKFIGTLASITENGTKYTSINNICYEAIDSSTPSVSTNQLKVVLHNPLENKTDRVNISVVCIATSIDTQAYTVVHNDAELLNTLKAIEDNLISTRDIYVAFDNSEIASTIDIDLTDKNINFIVKNGNTLNLKNVTFTNGIVNINGGGSVIGGIVGSGSFINFSQNLSSVSEVTVLASYDEVTATTAMINYLKEAFIDRMVDESISPVKNLSCYLDSSNVVKDTTNKTITVELNGNHYKAKYGIANSVIDTLDEIMSAQYATVMPSLEDAFDKTMFEYRTTYDLYMPTTLNNATISWTTSDEKTLSSIGKYNPQYKAKTVVLIAVVFENYETTYKYYVVRTAGMSYQDRMNYMLSFQDLIYEIKTKDPVALFAANEYQDILNIDSLKFTVVSGASQSDLDFTSDGEIDGDGYSSGLWSVAVKTVPANADVKLKVEGKFDDKDMETLPEGFDNTAFGEITLRIKVDGTTPANVFKAFEDNYGKVDSIIEGTDGHLSNINILTNILNHFNHELHDLSDDTKCGEGSFSLSQTYPFGSRTNSTAHGGESKDEAEYLFTYELVDIKVSKDEIDPRLNNGAVSLLGETELTHLKDGGNGREFEMNPNHYIFNVDPSKFKTTEKLMAVKVGIAVTNTGDPADDSGYKIYTISMPAAFVLYDAAGFTSIDNRGVEDEYLFNKARDIIEATYKRDVECPTFPKNTRKFILNYMLQAVNSSLTELDLSFDNGGKATSMDGLAYLTGVVKLNINNSHIGNVGTRASRKTSDLIANKRNLTHLYAAYCDLADISTITSLTNLQKVYLNGNTNLRTFSSLIMSAKTISELDLCDTNIRADIEGRTVDGSAQFFHSVLDEMYKQYKNANSNATPVYNFNEYYDETTSSMLSSTHPNTHYLYTPYIYNSADEEAIIKVCKEYAYRFDNMIDMYNVIHLQKDVVVANGEPSASITWEIKALINANGEIVDSSNYHTYRKGDNPNPNTGFKDKKIYLDMSGRYYRLTRGYEVTTNDNGQEIITYNSNSSENDITGWSIILRMSVNIANRSFSRTFYISLLDNRSTVTTTE